MCDGLHVTQREGMPSPMLHCHRFRRPTVVEVPGATNPRFYVGVECVANIGSGSRVSWMLVGPFEI